MTLLAEAPDEVNEGNDESSRAVKREDRLTDEMSSENGQEEEQHSRTFDSAPPPPGTTCYICWRGPTDDDVRKQEDEAGERSPNGQQRRAVGDGGGTARRIDVDDNSEGGPLLRNCACRGSDGYAHLPCRVKQATFACKRAWIAFCDAENPTSIDDVTNCWNVCVYCKQEYEGELALAMAEAYVKCVKFLPETAMLRCESMFNLAAKRRDRKDIDGAIEIAENLLRVLEFVKEARLWLCESLEAHTLILLARPLHMNKAYSPHLPLSTREAHARKACAYQEKAHRIYLDIFGPENEQTRLIENMLVNMKVDFDSETDEWQPTRPGDTKAAVQRARTTYEMLERNFGKTSKSTLLGAERLAKALSKDGESSEAVELLEQNLVTAKKVYGPSHSSTLEIEERLKELRLKHKGETHCFGEF